jgi:hypothetical protein
MSASLMPNGKQQYFNSNGGLLAGGQVFTYAAGTTTPKATWSDAAGTIPNANPVVLDARGEALIFWSGSYKVDVKDASGVSLTGYPVDNIVSDVLSVISVPGGAALVGSAAWYAPLIVGFDATKVPDGATVIFAGRTAQNDGGGGTFTYVKASVQTADSGTVFAPTGGGRLFRNGWTVFGFNGEASVKWFGAKGDGLTDDAVSLQLAATYQKATGGTLYFPPGNFMVSTTVTFDLTNNTGYGILKSSNIRGAGSGATKITYTTNDNNPAIQITGATGGNPLNFTTISGITVTTSNAAKGTGIRVVAGAYQRFEDVFTYNLFMHWDLTDVLSSTWTGCRIINGASGIYARKSLSSDPNALTFIGCTLGGMTAIGLQADYGSALTWVGGSFENNALSGGNNVAVLLNNPGREGGVAATFTGVYFEGNGGLADIRLIAAPGSNQVVTLNALGCNFNRISNVTYCEHPIRIDQVNASDPEVVVNLPGSSFRGFNTYVANAAREYVHFFSPSGAAYRLVDDGAIYQSITERPALLSSSPFAMITFTGATGALRRGVNIASTSRTSTGLYVFTFGEQGTGEYLLNYGAASTQCIAYITSQNAASVTIQFANPATSAPVDPSIGMVTLYQG